MRKFEIGKEYSMRSACDHECVWTYTVIDRTEKTITLKDDSGKIIKRGISKQTSEYLKAEAVRPLGSYSMAPILVA